MADLSVGVCRFCHCTDAQACEGGCSWTDAAQTLCSRCAAAAEIAGELVTILGVVAANPTSGLQLAHGTWDGLMPDQQRPLVLACRTLVDGLRDALVESLNLETMDAVIQVHTITTFLREHCPDEIGEDDAASQVVVRLLQRYVGNRIVLP